MRVALRPLRADDADRVLAWRNAPEVAAHMYTDHVVTAEEHARWIAAVLAAGDRRYWIVQMDDQPVGLANLVRIDGANRRCEFGFYLGEASARGTGAALAAMRLLIEQAFGPLGLHRLTGEALAENEAAIRLYRSLGFVEEGRLRAHVWRRGAFHDVVAFGMLAEDWAKAMPGVESRLRARGLEAAA